jgi:hypothetical protein
MLNKMKMRNIKVTYVTARKIHSKRRRIKVYYRYINAYKAFSQIVSFFLIYSDYWLYLAEKAQIVLTSKISKEKEIGFLNKNIAKIFSEIKMLRILKS